MTNRQSVKNPDIGHFTLLEIHENSRKESMWSNVVKFFSYSEIPNHCK
jgi:hypothetical protein